MALGILLLLSVFSAVISAPQIDINEYAPEWKRFEDPNGHPLYLVEVLWVPSGIFVAGRNILYHLNEDLKVIKRVELGPKYVCEAPERTCEKPVLKHYIPYSMQIIPNLSMLLLCSSLYGGACELRPLDNLESSVWIGPHGEPVSKCNALVHDPGFLAPINAGILKYLAFCGADTIAMGNRTTVRPFLSKKELVRENGTYQFKYSVDNATHISAAYFTRYTQTHLSSFYQKDYSYFFFLRSNISPPTFILSRLSNNVSGFSYRELPLACKDNSQIFTIGRYATLGPSELLFVLFTNETNSVICGFSMNDVKEHLSDDVYKFNERQDACEGNSDYCRSSRNPIHGSSSRLLSTPPLWNFRMKDMRSNVFRVVKQNGILVAFVEAIGETAHVVLKVNLLKESVDYFAVIDQQPVSLSTSFDLDNENIYFLQANTLHQFPIGSCSLYKTCKKCLKSLDPLKCGWCENRCDLQKNCPPGTYSQSTCSPNLFTFSPDKGPTWGKTLLTISGEDFGSKNGTYTINTVLVAGVNCTVLSWDDKRILCETGPTVEAVTGPIVITVLDATQYLSFAYRGTIASKSNFTYIKPKIYGIYPGKGFSRGGTNVTLYGENLDIGDEYSVNIYKKECVNPTVQSNFITCITSGHEKRGLTDSIQIVINGDSFYMEGPPPSNLPHAVSDFNYVPFPVIEKLYPSMLFASAGHNVTVTGLFLDSSTKTEMLLSFPTSEIYNHQPCWLDTDSKGTIMKCQTPDFSNHKEVVASRGYVKFRMDGAIVPSTESIFFLPDPVYEPFGETKNIPNSEKTLKLKGKFPNEEAAKESLKIQIGDRWLCNITQITDEWLYCTLPSEIMTDSSHWDNILTVQAFTDLSPQFIGSIIIQGTVTANPEGKAETQTKLPIFAIVLICLGAMVLVGIFIGVWRWKKASTPVSPNVKYEKELPKKTNDNTQSSNPFDPSISKPITFSKPPSSSRSSQQFVRSSNDYLSMNKNAIEASTSESEPLLFDIFGVDEETIKILRQEELIVDPKHLVSGKKLGEGQFGEVFKAKYNCPRRGKMIYVAVKTIKWDPENPKNEEFLKEGLKMKDFKHKNVIELIGICFEGGMPKLVIPFMENGDLRTYLQRDITLWYHDLLEYSTHIAAGMAYLAEEKFVHRDLAARNCVLDGFGTVKVADFGLTRDIYEKGYYNKETIRKLPLRWMSPESLEIGKYTTKSDVWSYGIVLWEIMTRGETPYGKSYSLEDIKNGYRLPKKNCCDRLYKVMRACWSIEPSHRPNFDDLYNYIKSMINSTSNTMYENC